MAEQQMETALITLEQAQELTRLLEQGQVGAANELLTQLCAPNASELFSRVGHLTRELHTALQDFTLDNRLLDIAKQEIPDARDHLNVVIEMTDKAANRTMDAVESCLPLADAFNDKVQQLLPAWQQLMSRQIELSDFKRLCHDLDDLLKGSEQDADTLRGLLTEILMAQDFQDLTGQMIKRVIKLVQEVETKLVEILTVFGESDLEQRRKAPTASEAINTALEAEGPIINAHERDDVVNGQDDVDDLLSSLGF